MFVELHMLQNFAPSCLNRDDTNSPKDCEFGGYRRARISSQCIKRAVRREASFGESLEALGAVVRTRRLILEVAQRASGKEPAPKEIVDVVAEVFRAGGIDRPEKKTTKDEEQKPEEKDNTKLILFMSKAALDEMGVAFKERMPSLQKGKKPKKGEKSERERLVDELGEMLVNSARVPSVALFGRMIEVKANTPFGKKNLGLDAAAQVAHAISTNAVSMEFDFFTAVDDLQPEEETGAGMMGVVEFNSACFYRYSNMSLDQLKKNLKGDEELARKTLEAFLRASVAAIPTGKQTSMAAQNPPDLVFAVVRDVGLWSLANAFVKPMRSSNGGLMVNSIKTLDTYWAKLVKMYGDGGVAERAVVTTEDGVLDCLKDAEVENIDALVEKVMSAVSFGEEA